MTDTIHYENKAGAEREGIINELMQDVYAPSTERKLGLALVCLGKYSAEQLAPALLESQHCYLAGIVTGTESKIAEWKTKYTIPDNNIYNYENFDQISNNKDIDILYIVLPNAMHAEYVIRGAKAGKHIICEKTNGVVCATM